MTDELKNNFQDERAPDDVVATDEEGTPIKPGKNRPTADDSDVVSDDAPNAQIKKLKDKIAELTEEKQKYLDNWQRDKAEFLNARRRDKEANEEFLKYAKGDLVAELIPVLDSFEMAMGNKEAWEKVEKNWRIGVEYIYNQLLTVLKGQGVEEVNPVGQKFDPMRDEALSFEPVTEESKDQVITTVVSKGYKLHGKFIKAPKVKVGEFKK